MPATIAYDAQRRRLLQPLLAVRHPHLRPLIAVQAAPGSLDLHYGDAPACPITCDGIAGAVRALHGAGLWVGGVAASMWCEPGGRRVLTGVGSAWDLRDPFAGHPAAGAFDLRIRWRQAADERELEDLDPALTGCR